MDSILEYFGNIPTVHRSILLFGGLAFFFIIENTLPLFRDQHNKWNHTGVNLFFTMTTILVNFSMAFILLKTADWVVTHKVGFLQMIDIPIILQILFGLVFFDLIGSYIPHYAEHKIKWMWQLHLVHHTDQHVSTTTANRHHPGESVIRFIFTTLAVVILGAPIWLVFLYQSLSVVLTQFNHSNIKMPTWLDDTLSTLFCTPNMHRVHHHYRQPYSDMNYGNIFSIWDRIFGTYMELDREKIVYGVDTFPDEEKNSSLKELLKQPFQGYRKPTRVEDV